MAGNVPAAAQPAVGARETLIALTLLAAGMVLRIWGAVSHPLEQDEMYTVLESRDLFNTALLPGIDARPLFYLIHHPLLDVYPDDIRWMRLLPLVFAAAGLWLTWVVGRRIGGVLAGLAALSLTAISPWHLYASEFARYWSLVYLVTLGFLHLTTKAYETDNRATFLLALLCGVVGAFSHPAFLFGIAGIAVALHAVKQDGSFGVRLPSRTAMLTLWAPLAATMGAWGAVLVLTSDTGAAQNFGGRGLRGTLMLLPAIAQWAQPAVLVAAGGGALAMLLSTPTRRFAAAGLGGAVCLIGLLFAAAWRTDVYADYAIGMLPFLHVGFGALVAQLPTVSLRDRLVVASVATAVFAAVLPSTVSHLIDGTRFDHRPALAYIRETDPSHPVMGWPETLLQEYGTGLTHIPYGGSPAKLSAAMDKSAFWLVLSAREYGYPWIDEASLRWVDGHCRRQATWQRLRLDSRQYRVELFWCGGGTPPESEG